MPAILKTTQIQEPSSATVNIGLDSSGNVGIGTITPTYKLDVSGSTNPVAIRLFNSTGASGLLFTQDTSDNSFVLNQGNGYLGLGTNNTERMRIDASGYMQGTVNGLSAGRIPAMQYFRLNSDLAGANVNTVQSVFGVGVTLVGSMQYAFDYYAVFSKSAGTTSHTFSIGFGGTATINNILYGGAYNNTNAAYAAGTIQSAASFDSNTAASTVLTGATTAAGKTNYIYLKGTVSINAGGTFIPQYTLSAAPGGAYSTIAGSYFAIWPLAASGSNVSIGSWA